MVSLYMFAAKTTIALASSTLAFSVGLQGILDRENEYSLTFLLISGWGFLLLSIVLILFSMKKGLDILYQFYNNLLANKDEINDQTAIAENCMGMTIVNGFLSFIFGVIFILSFIYINFLR